MKYIMQNINAFTGEVLRESYYEDLNQMIACIQHNENVEKNRDNTQSTIVLMDSEKKDMGRKI